MPAFRPKQLPRLLLRALARGLLFLLWLWLALAAAFQLHLLASRDGTLPRPILRLLEARLAREDIHISLDGATLGPDGVFLLQNPVFASGPGGHPLASARLLLAKIDLRKLPLGRLDIGDLLVSGLDLTLPAMLSESGRDETVVSGADLRLSATRRLLRVHHLTAAAGPLRLSASGALALDAPLDFPLLPTGGRKNLVPALQQALRETARRLPVLDALENPSLVVRLAPDTGGIANVTAAFRADALVNPPEIPFPLRAGQPAARLETPLRQTAAGARSLNLSAARLELSPPGVPPFVLDGVHARAAPGTGLDLAAARLRLPSRQAAAGPLVAHAAPLTDDRLRARAAFLLAGATTRLSADVNIPAASASVRAETAFGNALVAFLDSQQLLPARLAPLVRFPDDNAPARLRLAFDLNGSPRPANLAARLHSGPVAVRGVTLAEASAAVSLDGSRLLCEPLLLRTDASLAAVSYEMDTASLRFRFLLDGRLRPDDIAPWFPAWWPAIWTRFQFPRETPSASVAIAGQWNAAPPPALFLSVNAANPVVHGVPLDHAAALITIAPSERVRVSRFRAARDGRDASGCFTLVGEDPDRDWDRVTFAVNTSLAPDDIARLVTNAAALALAGAIAFDNPPRLVASGNYTLAPLSGALNATLASDGPARLAGVPLENLSLSASDNNGDIAIPALAARLAGGDLSAKLRIVLPRQAAAFDTANATASVEGTLRGARLARLKTLLAPLRKPPAGKQPAGETWTPDDTLDLAASVTTPLSDPARARGTASAAVVSPRLGEIHLLGGLSKLGLGSLMLTRLETDITLDEHLWNFANTRVTGPSARIEARGAADIVSERLNFRAKIYPVGETGAVLRNTLGVLLAPLSSILEVSLQGPFDAPRWFFSGGPTGILQNIGSDAPDLPPLPPDDSPKPAAKPGPR